MLRNVNTLISPHFLSDHHNSSGCIEQLFEYSKVYWSEAVQWSVKAWPLPQHLEQIQVWEDENYRIETGDLDYGMIIAEHLERLQKVKEDFLKMDTDTY